MATTSGDTMTNKIVEIAQSLGYAPKMEPDTAQFRIFGWFRGRKFRPDLRVENGSRSAVVVVKARSVMTYDVFLTHQARESRDAGALICVPDALFPQIRESTREYADELDVRLCRMSDVGEELKALLK